MQRHPRLRRAPVGLDAISVTDAALRAERGKPRRFGIRKRSDLRCLALPPRSSSKRRRSPVPARRTDHLRRLDRFMPDRGANALRLATLAPRHRVTTCGRFSRADPSSSRDSTRMPRGSRLHVGAVAESKTHDIRWTGGRHPLTHHHSAQPAPGERQRPAPARRSRRHRSAREVRVNARRLRGGNGATATGRVDG